MKTKEKHSGLNLVDWLILIPLIAGILLSGWYLWHHRTVAAQTGRDLLCVMRVPAVERSLLDAHGGELIPAGSYLRSANGTVILGTVQQVKAVERKTAVIRNGRVKWETDPGTVDLELTVLMHTDPPQEKDGWRVHDLRIAAGGRGSFRFGSYYATVAEILSVEVREP